FRPPAVRADAAAIGRDRAFVFQRVKLAREFVGTVYLESDLAELHDLIGHAAWTLGLALVIASFAAWLMALGLQRLISEPVLHLAATMRAVSERSDYSLRARGRNRDELGQLIDGFNAMLQQIEGRDEALRLHQE